MSSWSSTGETRVRMAHEVPAVPLPLTRSASRSTEVCCRHRLAHRVRLPALVEKDAGSNEKLLKAILAKKLRQKVEQNVKNCNNFATDSAHDQHIGYFDDDVYFYTIEHTRKQAFSN